MFQARTAELLLDYFRISLCGENAALAVDPAAPFVIPTEYSLLAYRGVEGGEYLNVEQIMAELS